MSKDNRTALDIVIGRLAATTFERETLRMWAEYGHFHADCEWDFGRAEREAETALEDIRLRRE